MIHPLSFNMKNDRFLYKTIQECCQAENSSVSRQGPYMNMGQTFSGVKHEKKRFGSPICFIRIYFSGKVAG
jgi:hypothetical protein